jgi:phospholipase B1, membrane-associated
MRDKVDYVAAQYRARLQKVANATPRSNTFAAIVQPMFSNLVIPNLNYISTFDCFHPSALAHQQMAIALWNTMFLPVDKKPLGVTFPQGLVCPANGAVFAT